MVLLVEVKDASNEEEEEDVGHIILLVARMRDVVSLSDTYLLVARLTFCCVVLEFCGILLGYHYCFACTAKCCFFRIL